LAWVPSDEPDVPFLSLFGVVGGIIELETPLKTRLDLFV